MTDQNDHGAERLKRTLLENGESPTEAESLATIAHFLDRLPAPEARILKQQQLLDSLVTSLPQRKTRWQRFREWYPVAVLDSQRYIVRRDIWPASALVLLIGMILTLIEPRILIFSALAPLVAAAGVAMIYDHEAMMMLELEEATRASGQLLLLARLSLVFGFDLILALIGSLILSLFHAELGISSLIMAWLAPMAFLSGLAFFLSIWLSDTFAAGVFSLGLWVLHLILKNADLGRFNLIRMLLAGLSNPVSYPLLFSAAILLVFAALLLVGRNEPPVREE